MKFLLLAVIIALVIWFARRGRGRVQPPNTPKAPTAPDAADAPQRMVACVQCGMHLPSAEALPGRGGVFCGEAHRLEYESAHPAP